MRGQVLGVILSFNALGEQVERYDITSKTNPIQSSDCHSCRNLKSFSIKSYSYKVHFTQGLSLGTGSLVGFEVSENKYLKDFSVVQFVRGCQFESTKINGLIKKRVSKAVYSFERVVPFKFNTWVVDSFDLDPVYGSSSTDRFFSYYWSQGSDRFNQQNEWRVREISPQNPFIYTYSFPGTAFRSNYNEAQNISLEYKSCLFESVNIPLRANSSYLKFDKAITCFDWSSSFIFNHDTYTFETKDKLDEFCLK